MNILSLLIFLSFSEAKKRAHNKTRASNEAKTDQYYEELNRRFKGAGNHSPGLLESSYECLRSNNEIRANGRRACKFRNLCYKPATKAFIYIQNIRRPVFYDKNGPYLDFGTNGRDFIDLHHGTVNHGVHNDWKLEIVENSSANGLKIDRIAGTSIFFNQYMDNANIGHLVFEDIGSLHITLQRFNRMSNPKDIHVVIQRDLGNSTIEKKFLDAFMPVVTENPIFSLHKSQSDLVCFEEFVIGGFARLFYSFRDQFNEGKEPLLFNYRDAILKRFDLNPMAQPSKELVVFINKTQSDWLGNGYTRGIYKLQQAVQHIKNTIADIEIQVIDPKVMSIKDQLQLMLKTTVLISPCGGISMIAVFLAIDSHFINTDYLAQRPESERRFGYKVGESASMEESFWRLWPHIHKHAYQIYSKNELFGKSRGNDRNSYSVILSMPRLEYLIRESLNTWRQLDIPSRLRSTSMVHDATNAVLKNDSLLNIGLTWSYVSLIFIPLIILFLVFRKNIRMQLIRLIQNFF